jgi:peptidoglycan L-alanyl-D-glutamate endopeptidase CwlK
MYKFSQSSLEKLASCHPDLQTLFKEVIKYMDCTIIEGFRGQAAQDKAFAEGKSKLKWPHGKHNAYPSNAVDVAPFVDGSIKWENLKQFYFFAGFVLGIAQQLKDQGKITHSIRFGGDWNQNNNISDESFVDAVHFELVL